MFSRRLWFLDLLHPSLEVARNTFVMNQDFSARARVFSQGGPRGEGNLGLRRHAEMRNVSGAGRAERSTNRAPSDLGGDNEDEEGFATPAASPAARHHLR